MGGKISRLREFVDKKRHSLECDSQNETGHDPAVHGARLEDRFYNNDSFSSPGIDPSDPQQQDAAVSIQTEFRRHSAKKEVDSMKEEEAATRIQAGFRGYQDRQKVLEMKDPDEFERQKEAESRLKGEEEEEVDIDLNDPEVADAALKIQAGFRGHKARQELKTSKLEEDKKRKQTGDLNAFFNNLLRPKKTVNKKKEQKEAFKFKVDPNDPEINNAATKIQAGFRGHRARKGVKGQKDSDTNEEPAKTDESKGNTEEEEIDIDLTDPEVAKAATKIQAGFRGHKTRQEMQDKTKETEESKTEEKTEEIDIDLNDPEVGKAATKIQAGFRGHQARQEIKSKQEGKSKEPSSDEKEEIKGDNNVEEEVDIDLNDPEVEKAATKIQAGFKGYKTRKEIKGKMEEAETAEPPSEEKSKQEEEEEVDIDLNDPDVEKAAVKIQAGFKGFQARKELNAQKETEGKAEETAPPSEEKKEEEKEEEIDIDLDDPETAKAALKIQAGFRGFQTRKELQTAREDSETKTESETKDDSAGQTEEDKGQTEEDKGQTEEDKGQTEEVKGEGETEQTEEAKGEGQSGEEEVDIDLNDPEVAKAAEKIQAGFKGYKVRKEMKTDSNTENAEGQTQENSKGESSGQGQEEEEVDIDLNDPEVEKAAVKIQAGFKGFKARKEMKDEQSGDDKE